MAWTATWNYHTLSRRNQAHQSPHHMYVHGIVQNGVRGVQVVQGDENREEYGIDWEDMDRPTIRNHHDTFNLLPGENLNGVNGNPFTVNHPDRLSHIEVPDAWCPFDAHKLHRFNTELRNLPTILSTDMHSHRLTWISTLALATAIAQD
jgi:hypothetical protein